MNTKIIIKHDKSTTPEPLMVEDSFELPPDSDINDWVETFKAILFRLEFQPATIDRAFGDSDSAANSD